jgi:peroxiredoxin
VTDAGSIKSALEQCSPPSYHQYLYDYLVQRAEKRYAPLAVGASAPEFYLEDPLDSLTSLGQFRDHVIYVSFWFAGCKPCIGEFPYENKLVRQFKEKPVKIISICTHTPKEKWLEMIGLHKLETVNLYANRAWQTKLEETYAISAYPHYVLIGKDGKIIDNFAKRPSQGIAEEIQAALSKQ